LASIRDLCSNPRNTRTLGKRGCILIKSLARRLPVGILEISVLLLFFKEAYDNMGWNMLHIPAGVSDRVGNISFYHVEKGANSEWGFTAVPQVCNGSVECRPEVLPVIRLADWIEEHISNRRLPQKVYGNYHQVDLKLVSLLCDWLHTAAGDTGFLQVAFSVMKMDIESYMNL
jgi:hypothetical protein